MQVATGDDTQHVEHLSIGNRAHQFDVLRVGPGQGHGGAGGAAGHQRRIGKRRSVPELLREQATGAGKGFHVADVGLRIAPRRDFVVGPFSRQQRPGTSNARGAEGLALVTLAVAVVVVAAVARAIGEVVLENGIDYPARYSG